MKVNARKVFSRFTYANIMSTLAVSLVLTGGAAYAANTVFSTDIVDGEVKAADIGQNQVNTGEITNNQVQSADVRDDTLTNGGLNAQDINSGAVGASELATDSVAFSELAFGTIPQFAYTKQASTATDTTTVKELSVTCDTRAADKVTGGGFVVANPGGNIPDVQVVRSYAVSPNTWIVRAVAFSGTPTWELTVVADCIG
jgi:hypothetical protein